MIFRRGFLIRAVFLAKTFNLQKFMILANVHCGNCVRAMRARMAGGL